MSDANTERRGSLVDPLRLAASKCGLADLLFIHLIGD